MMKYKKNNKLVRKTIAMDDQIWLQTQDYCYANNTSVSELIRKLLENFLKEQEKRSKKWTNADRTMKKSFLKKCIFLLTFKTKCI